MCVYVILYDNMLKFVSKTYLVYSYLHGANCFASIRMVCLCLTMLIAVKWLSGRSRQDGRLAIKTPRQGKHRKIHDEVQIQMNRAARSMMKFRYK